MIWFTFLIRPTLLLLAALIAGPAGAAAEDAATPTATASPATAIVYLTIANGGDTDDLLLGGETSAAQTVELHESVDEAGVLRMEPRPDGIAIPAGDTTAFDAGGLHVMLVGLTADLLPGGSYDLVLRFESAGELTVPVQIRFNAEPDDDEPVSEPVASGDLTISDAWSRPAPALLEDAAPAAGEPATLGTPVTAGGLSVVLTADGDTAGPRDLTVIVTGEDGEPVTDATVTISTNSLEMDHGVSTSETEMVEPGRYLADRVSMGMGGDWNAKVSIARPGAEAVVVEFVVTLDGPRH
ncbi:MAG: copper chaperone PCu(A)C [Actinomycetes bacterium]